jgi:hypothetical protein
MSTFCQIAAFFERVLMQQQSTSDPPSQRLLDFFLIFVFGVSMGNVHGQRLPRRLQIQQTDAVATDFAFYIVERCSVAHSSTFL